MDKIWLESYQKGVPHEIKLDDYKSIVELFESSCQKHSSRTSFENLGTALTYQALDELSTQFAAYLQSLGLKKGDRVAVMMPNLLQYPIAIFGILKAGLIVVNTNPLYTASELTHQMNDSGSKAIIVLANFAQTVEKSLANMPNLKHVIVTELGDLFPGLKRLLVNAVVKYVKKMVPKYTLPSAIQFRHALEKGKTLSFQPVDLSIEETAFLQYTGGTTGLAKGAVLSHQNLLANVAQATAWLSQENVTDEVIITALPLYHIFSLTANCLTFLKFGAKNILITNPRDIPHFIKEIKNQKFTTFTGVNTLYNALTHHPDFKQVDFSRLKLALAGGMALQKTVSEQWKGITGSFILEAYGLTETSPAVTINPLDLKDYNGSIGLPLPSTDVSIRDDKGKELPVGEEGELCIKGPQVMSEYWNKPEETANVFWKDGYLRSGDIAKLDEKGFVYIVDRKKDMILISGFNVYPNEVEHVLSMHPGILEAGVVGVKDEEGNEKVKAFVVKEDDTLTEEAIIKHCKEHLTAYKIPKLIEFTDELPKTNVGKILRRALR